MKTEPTYEELKAKYIESINDYNNLLNDYNNTATVAKDMLIFIGSQCDTVFEVITGRKPNEKETYKPLSPILITDTEMLQFNVLRNTWLVAANAIIAKKDIQTEIVRYMEEINHE